MGGAKTMNSQPTFNNQQSEWHPIWLAMKLNLIVLNSYEIKSMFDARINYSIPINNTILRKCDNRVFKQLRRNDFVSVVVYEAPYELKNSDLKSVLSKYGRIKGDVICHHQKGYDIENGNRSVLYYEIYQQPLFPCTHIPVGAREQGQSEIRWARYNCHMRSFCKSKDYNRGICPKEKEDIE